MSRAQRIGFALSLACAALGARPALAQDMMEYRVREGDTCGSIARHVYGDSRRYDRIHEHNPALGAMPHVLEAGTILTIPRPDGEREPDAVVTAVRREVTSQPPSSEDWNPARVGQELDHGWRVDTQERSTAELTFHGSSAVTVRERTLVIVYGEGVRADAHGHERAVVRQGSVLSRLSSLSGGDPLEVETPSALATLHAGEASVSVDEEGTTRVAVHEGEAATVSRPNGSSARSVPAGMGTRVRQGEAPDHLRRLPSPPRWDDDTPRRFLAVGRLGGTLRAAWSPAPDAQRYRVEVARREDGRDLVFATEAGADVRELEMRRVPAGTYYVRLSTVDEEGFEGRADAPIALTMLDAHVVAPGASAPPPRASGIEAALEDLDSGLTDLDFANLPDTPAEVPRYGQLVVPEGVRCTVGGADPSPDLVFEQVGDAVLRCEGGDPIASATIRVTPLSARLTDEVGDAPARLERGGDREVRVSLEGTADASGLTLRGGTEAQVSRVRPDGQGGLLASVHVADDAPDSVVLALVAGDRPIMELSAEVVDANAPPPSPEPVERRPQPHALQEGMGLAGFTSWVGLHDERRRGSGMYLAVTGVSARAGEPDARLRMTAGARASFLQERLRINAMMPLDIVGVTQHASQRGSRDLYASVSSLILDGVEGVGLAAEVGMWAPTGGGQTSLGHGRLVVAVDASYRFLDERLALRTRQAGIFDLVGSGSLLWASAYGFDIWIVGPLSAGVEVSMVIGTEDAAQALGVGLGGGLALDLDIVTVSLSGRYGVAEDAILGGVTATAAVRGSYEL